MKILHLSSNNNLCSYYIVHCSLSPFDRIARPKNNGIKMSVNRAGCVCSHHVVHHSLCPGVVLWSFDAWASLFTSFCSVFTFTSCDHVWLTGCWGWRVSVYFHFM